MNANVDPLAPYRGRLLGLAYRMLGSRADAEDVLQDAYLRFRDSRAVEKPEAFLTTMVTRLCLDRLKSARAKREVYVGPWLPEPVLDTEALSPEAATELADDLSFALLLALERLSPAERAAFLLHDVFDASFSDVAAILDKNEAACRQLAARARKAVRGSRPAAPASTEVHARLLAAFGEAVTSGDVTRLAALLREDAVMLSDGGGVKLAALNPIRGADKIARFYIGVSRKYAARRADVRVQGRAINGALGLLVYLDGVVDQTLSIAVDGDKIAAIYVVRNPEKLTGL
ncbi:MAG: sigma-70 family RNA polymerase sigma factor [Rhodospirillaceae bacterium]|nr:MAG: sigma-70 family RNA polymerase sigma factor [Rhodospirillaceae bacterium]